MIIWDGIFSNMPTSYSSNIKKVGPMQIHVKLSQMVSCRLIWRLQNLLWCQINFQKNLWIACYFRAFHVEWMRRMLTYDSSLPPWAKCKGCFTIWERTVTMFILLNFLLFLTQIEKSNCKGNTKYNQPRRANTTRVEIKKWCSSHYKKTRSESTQNQLFSVGFSTFGKTTSK